MAISEEEKMEIQSQVNDSINTALAKELAPAIKVTVNGKIDALRAENEAWHMERKEELRRIMPVVEAFEEAKTSGKRILWIATFIIAIGGAYEVIRGVFLH